MRTICRHFPLFIAALLAGSALSGPAHAALKTFRFEGITNTNTSDAAIGEDQLFVDVFDNASDPLWDDTLNKLATGHVGFRFRNTGPLDSSICDIYFEDGTLVSSMDGTIRASLGVKFTQGASPGNLPGGGGVGFKATPGFVADSAPPVQPNGVNPNEWVIISFELEPGLSYDHVIAALAKRPAKAGSGSLRIGIHVQGFAGGGSESFVNLPDPVPEPVPEPATVLLWGGLSLLGACGAFRRRLPE
ncbi:MAG: hypothetical protein WD872_14725 [Pirellulaceae bacterium]